MPDRRPNQRSSVYQGQDGWWHGWVTLGIRDDGSPDRRHRMGRTEAEVTRKVRALERARDTGQLASAGRGLSVGQWMDIWLTTIAPRRIRRSTLESTYAPKVRNRIVPALGKHRLDRLTPEHVERFYTRLEAEGLAPATLLQVHRILSRALKVAMQRVARNVATLVDGLRQGEALGLRWQHVDLDAGTIAIRWQLQRLNWRHGCADPSACAKDRHVDKCLPGCTGHARTCPRRTGGGLQLAELKSDKSRRTIALLAQLVQALRRTGPDSSRSA